jgi:hypothetical protein
VGKRNKQPRKSPAEGAKRQPALAETPDQPAALVAHPPARNPTLLIVSIVLFAAWFVFLLVTALLA